jgi:hypothetical protein
MYAGLGGAEGYGENSIKVTGVDIGNLDDGAVQIDITSVFGPTGINFYGSNYTDIYVSTNGLITLNGPSTSFQSTGLSSYNDPAISAFWSDIDITKGGDIFWDLDPVSGAVTITWLDVAPYSGSGVNSFQVVLTSTGAGNFEVAFVYEDVQWAQTSVSGNWYQATAGVTDGGSVDHELPGSGNVSAVSNYPTTDFGNGAAPGVYDLTVSAGMLACFGQGARILTARGPIPVEDIAPGDHVLTYELGWQPVLWAGHRAVTVDEMRQDPGLRPVVIRNGALGNTRRLLVSQQHAVLQGDYLVRARYLADYCGGQVARIKTRPEPVTFHHLLTPRHSLVQSEGIWTETFLPGARATKILGNSTISAVKEAAAQAGVTQFEPARPYATRRDIRKGKVRLGLCPTDAPALSNDYVLGELVSM